MTEHKQYLGDGVYVDVDNHGGMVLTTEDGTRVIHEIWIEASVWHALVRWVEQMKQKAKAGGDDECN